MHRATLPYCQCAETGTTFPTNCEDQCSMDEEEITILSFHPPLVDKPWKIRQTRDHRSWMTHLPLSRPGKTITAI